jgi:hypothetical protein
MCAPRAQPPREARGPRRIWQIQTCIWRVSGTVSADTRYLPVTAQIRPDTVQIRSLFSDGHERSAARAHPCRRKSALAFAQASHAASSGCCVRLRTLGNREAGRCFVSDDGKLGTKHQAPQRVSAETTHRRSAPITLRGSSLVAFLRALRCSVRIRCATSSIRCARPACWRLWQSVPARHEGPARTEALG